MKIILKEDIQGLGYKDDVLVVKDGYGRNYLIPTGKAILATPSALRHHEEILKQRAHKIEKIKLDAENAAKVLEGVELTIAAKVSPQGNIYGSVGAAQVAEALEKLGKEIDRKLISVGAIKQVGEYMATVRFHKEVAVEVPVKVVAEKEEKEAPKAEEAPKAAPVVEEPAEETPETPAEEEA